MWKQLAGDLPKHALKKQCSLSAYLPWDSVTFDGWHLSKWLAERIVTAVVHSRCSTLMSYPGSSGCGPKGHEVECRLLSRTLCFLVVVCCSSPKQVCSDMSLPSMKHLFLFARTFHSLCLLLLKGHLKWCSERMYFPLNALYQVPFSFSC